MNENEEKIKQYQLKLEQKKFIVFLKLIFL